MKKMKANGYVRGGVAGKKTTVSRAAPRGEKIVAGKTATAARTVKNTGMGSKEAGPSRARSGAGTGRSISELSDAQKNLLRSVQSTGKKQSTSVIDDLTKKYGNLAAREERKNLKKKAPRPPGMNLGGAAMKTKGYAKGGAAMKTKGAAKGGIKKPSSKKTGLFGRR